ncbi:MAG: RluA family pseudouridine synthase [Gammaproteobacteria bacterium]
MRERASGAHAAGAASSGPVRQVRIDEDRTGQRLDNFVVGLCKGVPKSHLYRLIRSGQVRVNGGRRSADYRLQGGDTIRVPPLRMAAAPAAHGPGSDPVQRSRAALADRLPVLYEDDALVVIDKPESVAVHGGSGVSSGVIEQLRAARPEARFLELAHRIDRGTSGILVVARKRQALLALQAQWRERAPEKSYLAIVAGRWPLRSKTLAFPLLRRAAPNGDRRVAVHAAGQEAITRVRGLAQFELHAAGDFTLVEARIETGRTHQIRVHLTHAGFPIAGDDKYGDFALNRALARGEQVPGLRFERMFLHARRLAFDHPATGQCVELEAPLPPELQQFLAHAAPL